MLLLMNLTPEVVATSRTICGFVVEVVVVVVVPPFRSSEEDGESVSEMVLVSAEDSFGEISEKPFNSHFITYT
jgi:hypothetical protein